MDTRTKLFQKIIEFVDEIELEELNLGFFTKGKSKKILDELEKSDDPENLLFDILLENLFENDLKEEIRKNEDNILIDLSHESYSLNDIPESCSNNIRTIGYLNDLIKKCKNNEVKFTTSISLLKDGTVSIWMPVGISADLKDENIYTPIIETLQMLEEDKSYN